MMKKILERSRLVVVIAVAGCLISTIALFGLGFYEIINTLLHVATGEYELKTVALKLIEVVDTFLMGTVFLIIAIGLYELFVDGTLAIPDWLDIGSLDQLKRKLVGIIIIVLGVQFMGNSAKWTQGTDILYLGVGVAAVIAALTYFIHKTAPKQPPQ